MTVPGMPGNEIQLNKTYIPCSPILSSNANLEQVMMPVVMHVMLVGIERAGDPFKLREGLLERLVFKLEGKGGVELTQMPKVGAC